MGRECPSWPCSRECAGPGGPQGPVRWLEGQGFCEGSVLWDKINTGYSGFRSIASEPGARVAVVKHMQRHLQGAVLGFGVLHK